MTQPRRTSSSQRRLHRLAGLVAALVVFLVAAPAAAQASTVSRTGSTITFTAAPGETNDVRISSGPIGLVITDTAGLTAAGDCTQVSPTEANCGVDGDFVISLGDGNDSLFEAGSFRPVHVDGGPGDDKLQGDQAVDVFHGGAGKDEIDGGGGADQLFGDAGDDYLKGGTGDDQLDGGSGKDVLEGDGHLYCACDGGNDTINSRDGEYDRGTCGAGYDTVISDSIDNITGGEGLNSCESVDKAAPSPGTDPAPEIVGTQPQPGGSFGVALGARTSVKMSKLLSKNGFPFALAVNAPCRGTGKLVVAAAEARRRGLGKSSVTLASDTFAVPDAGTYAAGVTVKPQYRKKLKSLTKLTATLSFSCVAKGVTKSTSQKVTFKR
jgi:hypothetical protein